MKNKLLILGTYEDAERELLRLTNTVETPQSRIDQGNKTKEIESVLRVTHNFAHVQPILSGVPNPFKSNELSERSKNTHSRGNNFK